MHRLGRRSFTVALICVFLIVSVTPSLLYPKPAFAQSPPFAPPLAIPEDPLGQQTEEELPDVSIDVDVRDGHLTARVVDIWGPGRVPLVVRAYTNAQPREPVYQVGVGPAPPQNGPFRWHFNHRLDIVGAEVLEANGNRSSFRFTGERTSADNLHKWQTYVKDNGTYAVMEVHYNCVEREPIDRGSATASRSPRAPSGLRIRNNIQATSLSCTWDGAHTVYRAKAGVRTFSGSRIIEDRDGNGNRTTYSYQTFADGIESVLSTVTDPVQRSTNYTHERAYQLCTKKGGIENIGECVEYKWVYRPTLVADPYGRTAQYTYDGNTLKITSARNASGGTTYYTYTASGLLESIKNARGFATTFQWVSGPDGSPRINRVIGPNGETTTYAYAHETTSPYRVIRTQVTNARNYTTTFDIANGDVTKITNPLGHATQYKYDSRHNMTEVVDPRGATNPAGYKTTFTYNTHNKVTQIVQSVGGLDLTTILTWDSPDTLPLAENLRSVTNPRGIQTTYEYDAKHNLKNVRRAVGKSEEALTQYTYHPWGGVASVTDPRGKITTYAYTTRRQLQVVTPPAGGTTTYGYDPATDDQITMTNGNGRTWTIGYTVSRFVASVKGPLNHVIEHEYDANGNRTKTYDAKDQVTTFTYDNRDRTISITDAMNGLTRYEYDAVGNLKKITNSRNFSTTFTYDEADRIRQVTDALNQTMTYSYDPAGNRASMLDRRGTTHTHTYDQVNRLRTVTAGSLNIAYDYDANGNRKSMTDATGTTGYAYDSLDRLTEITYPDTRKVRHSYDKAGNRTLLTYPDGSTTMGYEYDNANRLIRMTVGTLAWTLGYDNAGNRTLLTQPNGVRVEYAYRTNNWLSAITHKRPDGSVFQSFVYDYDANGNRISQTDPTGMTTFTYDALNRLKTAAYPGTYGAWSWEYDAVGNRISETKSSGTIVYTYDGNNRLTHVGTNQYTYDENGNLRSDPQGRTYAWDALNRLTQLSYSVFTIAYTYNGDGLKVRRTTQSGSSTTTVDYYHDGIQPIWEIFSGSTVLQRQIDRDLFSNLLSRRTIGGSRHYFGHDGLGSATAQSDEAGAAFATRFFDAWGLTRPGGSGSWSGATLFAGGELEQASIYHMGARFYDPEIGRWLSEDPIQDQHFEPLTFNFYVYAGNNPVILADPTGESIQEAVKAWLESGEDAIAKLKEVYAMMAEAYRFLEQNAALTREVLVHGVLSGIGLAMTLNLPSDASEFGKLVADLSQNPGNWRVSHVFTAASRTHKGAYSSKFIFQRVSDGAVVGYHVIAAGGRLVTKPHFVQGTLEKLIKWIFK